MKFVNNFDTWKLKSNWNCTWLMDFGIEPNFIWIEFVFNVNDNLRKCRWYIWKILRIKFYESLK